MTETEYLKLKKPAQEDFYNVDDMNRNSDLIDAKLKTLASDLEVTNTELANKANIAALGQPGGIATLNGNGKLVQMPTAADVGAIKLRWSTLINETTATPNKYNFDDYITPGDVVSVDNYASAQSIANIPEAVPGKLYVLPLRTDDQGRNDIMQEYHTVTGNIHCRPRYYYSGDKWSGWNAPWIKPSLNAPFTASPNVPVKYRRENNMVIITGWLLNIKLFADIFTLEPGYKPSNECNFVVAQSENSGGSGIARIHIAGGTGIVSLMGVTYNSKLEFGCGIDISFPIN